MQKLLKDRDDCPGRYSGVTILSSKLKCGVCGSMYTPRPWHSTSYNHLVWQCRNRTKKGAKCPTHNVYDGLLHYLIHSAARTLAINRKVTQTVMEIVLQAADESKADTIRQWMFLLGQKDIWRMLSDEDDIALIVSEIKVMPNKTLKFKLIDGKGVDCALPNYSPKKGIKNDDR